MRPPIGTVRRRQEPLQHLLQQHRGDSTCPHTRQASAQLALPGHTTCAGLLQRSKAPPPPQHARTPPSVL